MKASFGIIILAALTLLPFSAQAESNLEVTINEYEACENQRYAERKQLVAAVINEYSEPDSMARTAYNDLQEIRSELLDEYASNPYIVKSIEQFIRDVEDIILEMLYQEGENQAFAAEYLQATKTSISKFLKCIKLDD